jgi:hypothetical protein
MLADCFQFFQCRFAREVMVRIRAQMDLRMTAIAVQECGTDQAKSVDDLVVSDLF